MASSKKYQKIEDQAVSNFREYLRIKSVADDPEDPVADYDDAVSFLKKMADEIGLDFQCVEVLPKYPVVIMTWHGRKPELTTLILNSHMDTVPVFEDKWTHDPFAAVKTEDGNIYGRGAQDMKSVGIQYIEAVRRLKQSGFKPLRTIHLTFMSEEEIWGLGMQNFVKHEAFPKLNFGFGLDEGKTCAGEEMLMYYGEKGSGWIQVTITGDTGHGSQFIQNNVGEKVRKIVNSFLGFRNEQEEYMKKNNLKTRDVCLVNLTKMEGGIQYNVVPECMKIDFDVRVCKGVSLEDLDKMVRKWCEAAGEGVTYEWKFGQDTTVTPLSEDNPWWVAFRDVMKNENIKVEPIIGEVATDSRFLRQLGYKCFGFSPINNTPVLLHSHDEFLNEKVFLRGIDIYEKLIPSLADVPPESTNET